MRPAGVIGILLIVFGGIVLAMRGFSYVTERDKVDLGVATVVTEKKGFVPPWVGGVALVAGIVLLFSSRRGSRV